MQGSGDQSPNRHHKSTTLVENRYAGNQMSNGLTSKHDGKEKVMALFIFFYFVIRGVIMLSGHNWCTFGACLLTLLQFFFSHLFRG